MAASVFVLGSANVLLALGSGLLLGVILVFLIPVLINLFLNLARIYSVPRAEYILLGIAFYSMALLISGLLNLIALITPLVAVWGNVLFPFVGKVVGLISFYAVTAKLYFNDVNRIYYFKAYAVFAVIVIVLFGGIL
ncbi:MAG: hypothetical protein NC350_03395 [Corallococcus sp.]|nr:hypothetical protein [Corallococcus sp.]